MSKTTREVDEACLRESWYDDIVFSRVIGSPCGL